MKKNRGNGRVHKGSLDDESLMLASAPATHEVEKPRTIKKSATYLNMTSSFNEKVKGNLRSS